MIRYYRLFDLLARRGMKKQDLYAIMTPPIVAKMTKGESITTTTIAKICAFLDCQPGDIMEYVPIPKNEKEPPEE